MKIDGPLVSVALGCLALGALTYSNRAVETSTTGPQKPSFSLPLDCIAGKTCFIQNYVDVDPTSAVIDYRCDKASYAGHKGVDFRILSLSEMKKGVQVRAVADGVVKFVRDGMSDQLGKGMADSSFKGRECGNGAVIDHGEGWETQLCHLRMGSLVVKPGEHVKRGQKIGFVGLSGKTTFPHVHLSVRHNGEVIDPFSGTTPKNTGCLDGPSSDALWKKDVLRQFPHSDGQPFIWGFADGAVKEQSLMNKGGVPAPRTTKAPALVYYGLALNLQKGDQLKIKLTGPKGVIVETTSDAMNRHKASYLLFSGKRRLDFAWPSGTYTGALSLLREGRQVWQKSERLQLK